MRDFVFGEWELDRETDKIISVFRWGVRKSKIYGEVHPIKVTLTLGKGDLASMLETYEPDYDDRRQVMCDDLADLLNKMESFLA